MFPKNIVQFALLLILSMVICMPLKYFILDRLFNQDLAMHLLFIGFSIFFVLFVHLINFKNRVKLNYVIIPFDVNFILFVLIIIWTLQTLFIIPINHFLFPNNSFQPSLYFILGAVVVAPFLEEIIFRNILLNSLLNNYNKKKSVIISAFLFGLIHIQPIQIVFATIVGFLLGMVYAKNKNIAYTIILHSFSNAIVLLINFLTNKFSTALFFDISIGVNIIISISVLYYMNIKYGFSIQKLIQEIND
ncbi:CPBP family intramembrane glutamic endopeptidase [Flavobacterium aquicola]|uniref:CAAX prenyl protease 2/Lysostaphin resistance protein A-like domain-containing protein n=1 Tax=Flavobacterium aquicola TaxID=1682742 RepID=A0A3E0EPR6_9FLAO|nr:type II CAAX endopeptidase family protein [Flavobacterium aquicola]REH00096.1 hypothetical protein C8P67_10364 [Flavobacterium aquicola]